MNPYFALLRGSKDVGSDTAKKRSEALKPGATISYAPEQERGFEIQSQS